jgi:branched-subunit amino acid transport protein AzlD
MNTNWLRIGAVAIGFLLVFVAGYWLARAGRPYGTVLLTVHKLIAVGILVFLGVSAFGANKVSPLGAGVWLIVALAALAFVATIAAGGVLSAVTSPPAAVAVLHKVAPYVTLLLTAAAFYLLLWRKV